MKSKFRIKYVTVHSGIRHTTIKADSFEEAISLLVKEKHEIIYHVLNWKKK